MITFNEEEHKYTNTETNETYISVTTVLGLYKKKFDSEHHAARIAKREGVTTEMILEMWEAETKKACDKGTKIHKLMEDYIRNGVKRVGFDCFYSSYDNVCKEQVPKYKNVLSENLLYNHAFKLAGTADLIYDHGDYFTVGDFKTNKKFRFESSFNEFHLAPIDHIPYCEHNTYALQLSTYAYMYEELTGKKCKKIFVYYMEDYKWKPINMNYMRSDVVAMLRHYRESSLWKTPSCTK